MKKFILPILLFASSTAFALPNIKEQPHKIVEAGFDKYYTQKDGDLINFERVMTGDRLYYQGFCKNTDTMVLISFEGNDASCMVTYRDGNVEYSDFYHNSTITGYKPLVHYFNFEGEGRFVFITSDLGSLGFYQTL